MSRKYPNPWSVWLTATVGSFVAMETRALVKGDIPTLSECLARWSGVHPRRRHGSVAPLAFVAGAGRVPRSTRPPRRDMTSRLTGSCGAGFLRR